MGWRLDRRNSSNNRQGTTQAYILIFSFHADKYDRLAMTIPVIDAAALTGGDEQQLAVFRAKLLDGLKTYGFVKLINHTVPVPLVAETFDQVCSVPPLVWYP